MPSCSTFRIVGVLILAWLGMPCTQALDFPGAAPGPAQAHSDGQRMVVENAVLSCVWSASGEQLRPVSVIDRMASRTINLEQMEVFQLLLRDGRTLPASALELAGPPRIVELAPEPEASTLARRFAGRALVVDLASEDGTLRVQWQAILRDGANAIRQEVSFTAARSDLLVKEIILVDVPADHAEFVGGVPGSPLVVGNLFFAYEHPNSASRLHSINAGNLALGKTAAAGGPFRAQCLLTLDAPLERGRPSVQSCAVGVVPKGQLRRGFLYYVERERAHPYRPFLHYNSWYDISWSKTKFSEADCLRVVQAWGRELTEKRGLSLSSFVWDDGWDDPKTLWRPSAEGFPHGFSNVLSEARRFGSTNGFWQSPFGGYGQAATDRYAYGRQQGFEFKRNRFQLAGPRYYARFLESCTEMIDKYGANFFKFDGLTPDIPETEAMLRLTRALRERKPDLFISITAGTWPSPYWLWYGDSTWRGGGDMGLHGAGTTREQWLTFRDMRTYRYVVQRAPLYPLNSIMNQGIAQSRYGYAGGIGNSSQEIRREVRSFFGCGTCLQELYIAADKMAPENWDDLVEAARWSQANADVLVDTHWLGGDPGKAELYGWASWSERKGILCLRNPAPRAATMTIDLADAFELPPGARKVYRLHSPWHDDAGAPPLVVTAGRPHTFTLQPFEVVVVDAVPADSTGGREP